MPQKDETALSPEAFNELKQITQREYGDAISDAEIEEMGVRLLKLFSLLYPNDPVVEPAVHKPSKDELTALRYIYSAIYHDKKQPTVRGIAEVLGFRSSRTGFRMLHVLIEAGFIYRDAEEKICMREDVPGFHEVLGA